MMTFQDLDPRWISVFVSTIGVIVSILIATVPLLVRKRREQKREQNSATATAETGVSWSFKKSLQDLSTIPFAVGAIANPWLKIFMLLAMLSIMGILLFFVYHGKSIDPYIGLSIAIFVIALFLITFVKQHKEYLLMWQEREELKKKLREMAAEQKEFREKLRKMANGYGQ